MNVIVGEWLEKPKYVRLANLIQVSKEQEAARQRKKDAKKSKIKIRLSGRTLKRNLLKSLY